MMLRLNYFVVDSFARMPFTGNPAAVCLVEQVLADEDMQQIAAEFNLSETAFVSRNAGSYSIRWFTPTTEVDLCGHATLAATKGLLISIADLKNAEPPAPATAVFTEKRR